MSNLWDAQQPTPVNTTVVPGETLPQVFWNAAALRGERVFMRRKLLGLWESWSWQQTSTAVREIAMGLAALGFEPGDCASILSNTVLEWVLADLAIQSAGGVTNGVYPTDSTAQLQYLSADSASSVLFVEDEEQLDKALEVREQLPLLKKIIVFDMRGLRHFCRCGCAEPGGTARAGAGA